MRAMVGVSVMGKADMVPWIMEGIRDCFNEGTHVVFYFEACEDVSEEVFDQLAPHLLHGFRWSKLGSSKTHIFEQGCHRLLLEHFLTTNCDYLIVPHDDNRFLDKNIPAQIETVINHYTTKLGWIGCRDGYNLGYSDMISSQFSASNIARAKIENGKWEERIMLNTGPVIYTRYLIKHFGLPDPDLKWYWWDEFSLRIHQAGLTNVLLGMDCAHQKFGKVQGMPEGLYSNETVAADLAKFRARWSPFLGKNPL